MPARPMRSFANNSSDSAPRSTMVYPKLVDGSGYEWIPSKLSSFSAVTRLRFLPSFEDNGQELDALIPGGDKTIPDTCLGDAFVKEQVCSTFKNNVRALTITSLAVRDRKGNPIPLAKQTVADSIVKSFNWMCFSSSIRVQRGYAATVPEQWADMHKRKVTNEEPPKTALLVRCLAFQIDDQVKYDENKRMSSTLGVFHIPASALGGFYENILKRRDQKLGFIPSNIPAQSDFFSCKAGYSLDLTKTQKRGKDNSVSASYSLTSFEQTPLPAEEVFKLYKPWEQIIQYPTVEDQIEFFLELLGPEAVDFGLRESPYASYIPAAVRGAAKGLLREQMNKAQLESLPVVEKSATVSVPANNDNIDYGTPKAAVHAPAVMPAPVHKPIATVTGDEPDEEEEVAPPPGASDFQSKLASTMSQFRLPTR